ncbi:MAG: glycosyltransferase, partial [Kiritimatiellae bacterium]|nr:glycosyltransferase [Kiritimatiellia bacterium]
MSALDRITLVIVTWKGDGMLRKCLDSVVRACGALPETVVVDNAALDSTAALVGSYANARYLPLPENRGFAGGNNAAAPFCKREYTVLLNNDTELAGDAFTPLVEFLDARPEAAAAQGKIVFAARNQLDGCGGFLSPLGVLAFRGAFADDSPEFSAPARVFTVGGAFFAVRNAAVAACGGLFYDHFKSYYEEINLCHRLAVAGYDCWYVPTPPVMHLHSATASKFRREDILEQYYRNVWFSNLTCFNAWNRLRFGAILAALCAGQAAAALLRGDTGPLKAHWRAAKRLLRELRPGGEVRRTRAA